MGISHAQAKKLLIQFGLNEIVEKQRQTSLMIFFSQFMSALVLLLVVAAIVSLFLGDMIDGLFILLIILLNGCLGFIQEYKAEKAIAALKNMTSVLVRVIRDGAEQKIESKYLVPGDIIVIEQGDKIPADCELIECLHIEVNESPLTGESMPIEKNLLNAQERLIYFGTIVAKGRGKARVVTTGMQTKFGHIAQTLSEINDEDTPLQKKLDRLGKQLGIMALGASGVVFIIGILKENVFIEMLLTSISLAVAAVPEGLPAVITITLAVGMQRMATKRAILRKLSSIEALGSVSVIATDKTGTLTRNEMRVDKYWINGRAHSSHDVSFRDQETYFKMMNAGVLCNNASLVFTHDKKRFDVLGDSTEGALLLFANDHAINLEKIKRQGKLVEEFTFDSTAKMMSVVWKDAQGAHIYTKGAPEIVLERCEYLQQKTTITKITNDDREHIEFSFREFAKEGLRVIALAYKNVRGVPRERKSAEEKLIFIGFVGIADPARPEVKDAILLAERAGIRTIMITGDNELTANAIATKVGLIQPREEIVTGIQLAGLTDEQVKMRLPYIRVFARTTPEQKLRIVQLLQDIGHIVAVTGDGVNDSLALKQSNVGVAMGITGTDVAKEAADMVLTDDNYATLVTAVEEGRTIFDNIKSAVKYLVGCNIGEIVAVGIGMLLGWPVILTPLQLLYINLVTDGLPAIALAVTPKHEGLMRRPPRDTKNMFEKVDTYWFIEVSTLTAGLTLLAFWVGLQTGQLLVARAYAFTTIILVQHFVLLDVWARERSISKMNILQNNFFLFAFISPLILQGLLLYLSVLREVFHISSLTIVQIGWVLAISFVVLIASEVRKLFAYRIK